MLTSLQLSEAELQVLNCERYCSNPALIQKRLHCVYAKAVLGLKNQKIASLYDVNAKPVGLYIRQYGSAIQCVDEFFEHRKIGFKIVLGSLKTASESDLSFSINTLNRTTGNIMKVV